MAWASSRGGLPAAFESTIAAFTAKSPCVGSRGALDGEAGVGGGPAPVGGAPREGLTEELYDAVSSPYGGRVIPSADAPRKEVAEPRPALTDSSRTPRSAGSATRGRGASAPQRAQRSGRARRRSAATRRS